MKVRVKVKPGAQQDAVFPQANGTLVVQVRARAEDNAANQALVKALAHWAGIAASNVEITNGHTARFKTVELHGLEVLPT